MSERYRVVRALGRGGMAEVFEAVVLGEGSFERRVAIKKILPGHENDPSFARMFLDEARIASRLHHANIVAILDCGVADRLPFQVLEFVDGRDIYALCKQARDVEFAFPAELALFVCREIALALEHAHSARDAQGHPLGIVHRDVTPSNILVSRDGDVKLSDFGVAFAFERSEKTATGLAKGKAAFMAPEQLLGGQIDGRTDVFALGCSLHALMAGRSPLAVENRIASLLAGRPLDLDADVPADVRAIVARATRLDRADRFATAAEMAETITEAMRLRSTRDGRAMLRQWIAALEAQTPAKPSVQSNLDALFDLQLVAGIEADGEREFQTTPSTPRSRVGDSHAVAPTVAAKRRRPNAGDPHGGGVVPVPASDGLAQPRWRFVAGLALVGAAGVLVSSIGLGRHWNVRAAPVVRAPLSRASDSVREPPATPVPVHPVDEVAAEPSAADAAMHAPVTAERASVEGTNPVPHASRPIVAAHDVHASSVATVEHVDAAETTTRGWLLVAGNAFQAAEIRVDGHSMGFAPKRVELSEGRHDVVLVFRDGRANRERTIAISALNTRAQPVRWSEE